MDGDLHGSSCSKLGGRANEVCGDNGAAIPDFCKYAAPDEGSGMCDPFSNDARQIFLDTVGCGSGDVGTSGGSTMPGFECMGEDTACMVAGTKKLCTSCNEDGVCHQFTTEAFFDPTVAGITCPAGATNCIDLGVTTLKSKPKKKCAEGDTDCNEEVKSGEDDEEKTDPKNPPLISTVGYKPGKKEPCVAGTRGCVTSADKSETKAAKAKTTAKKVAEKKKSKAEKKAVKKKRKAKKETEKKKKEGVPTTADPVGISSGALLVDVSDLAFKGIEAPLNFSRSYDSQSLSRGVLGSNWRHNWEVRLVPLKKANAPDWTATYCKEWAPFSTCLMFHDNDGSQSLFVWDPKDELYKPQAGSYDHIKPILNGGYIMDSPEGVERRFDEFGYLTRTSDRFGNWNAIEYEATPVFLIYRRYCTDETTFFFDKENLDHRLCNVLANIFGDRPKADLPHEGWSLEGQHNIKLPAEYWPEIAPHSYENTSIPDNLSTNDGYGGDYRSRLLEARTYFKKILVSGYYPDIPTGDLRFRPTKVQDNLGRSLKFSYANHFSENDNIKTSEFGLLKSVEGPTGAHVVYSYDQPSVDFPANLNESFLVHVDRKYLPNSENSRGIDDSLWRDRENAGNSRVFQYHYQWPENSSGNIPTWQTHADSLRDAWTQYFGIIVGCHAIVRTGGVANDCTNSEPHQRSGNVCVLGDEQRDHYISNIADNIVAIERNDNIEVFSEYDVDPAGAFDRVILQRYGGEFSGSDGTIYARSQSLPLFTLDYISAGPVSSYANAVDATEAFLPSEISSRYALEIDLSTPKEDDLLCLDLECEVAEESFEVEISPTTECSWDSLSQDSIQACQYLEIDNRAAMLPGFKPTLNYFQSGNMFPDTVLQRSRLTCEQLARAAIGDPFHNDLIAVLEPVTATTDDETDYVSTLITGQRDRVAKDGNRICAWTHTKDRDGNEMYYGVNFRSQVLVSATKTDSSEYVFEDIFTNADGNVIVEKKPARGTDQTIQEGTTLYTYSEIDPDGNNGWNIDLPAYWGKRANLVEVLEVPKAPVYEAAANPSDSDAYSHGKILSFSYEPLFNQLRKMTHSNQKPDGTREDLYSVTNEFDYQEFSPLQSGVFDPDNENHPMTTALFDQLRLGRNWYLKESELNPGKAAIDNTEGSILRQFTFQGTQGRQRMPFYGADLNGDGIHGFPTDSENILSRAKAVPVRVIVEDLTGQSANRKTYISWAPNGKPAGILESNGKLTSFSYYPTKYETNSFEDVFGPTAEPTSNQISSANRGLLAQVSWNEYDESYPSESAGEVVPCEYLKGPYQWALPDCTSGDLLAQLESLNIPSNVAEQLLDTQTGKEKTFSLSYSEIGQPYRVWENGRLSMTNHDTDGRVTQEVDTKQNVFTYSYDNDGNQTSFKAFDLNTYEQTFDKRRLSDNEGKILAECTALVSGGCDGFPNNIPALGHSSPSGAQIIVNQYTDEGLLDRHQDPEGTLTYYTYDSRKRLKNVRIADPQNPTGGRETTYFYDDKSRSTAVIYGTPGQDQLSETRVYDGYNRAVSWTDKRGTQWQGAYAKMDQLVYQFQSSIPFGIAGVDTSSYFQHFTFNGHQELLSTNNNDLVNTQYTRFPDGRIWSIASTGGGTAYMSYDTAGNIVWQQSPHYDASISVRTVNSAGIAPVASTIQILREFDGQVYAQTGVPELSNNFLTSTTRTAFSEQFEPLEQTTTANNGLSTTQSWEYSALGSLIKFTNPEGNETNYLRNLVGWPTRESRDTKSDPQVTDKAYNSRGQKTHLVDPRGEVAEWVYNGFGDLFQEFRPGSSAPYRTTEYDSLGRPSTQENAAQEVVNFVYDSQSGDAISTRWLNGPLGAMDIVTRNYDLLGRVVDETNLNPGATSIPRSIAEISSFYTYDPLGRLVHETRTNGQDTILDLDYSFSSSTEGWERITTYPSGDELIESSDLDGRIFRSEIIKDNVSSMHHHNYTGGIYRGRKHDWVERSNGLSPDPMAFDRTLDGFGRPIEWTVQALEFQNADPQFPTNLSWADSYCGGEYNDSRCGKPVMKISAIRDVLGRVASLNTRFSHPMEDGNSPIDDGFHWDRWRGYTYNKLGFLARSMERETQGYDPVDTDVLEPNAIVSSDLNNVANGVGAESWLRYRDLKIGSMNQIRNAATGEIRWKSIRTRGAGHRLRRIRVDGLNYTIKHDGLGRAIESLDFELSYDALSRLTEAYHPDSGAYERYAYDAQGRLAYVYSSVDNSVQHFAHDGARMVAATDENYDLIWQSFQGPDLDLILEFHDENQAIIPIIDNRKSIAGAWDMTDGFMVGVATYDEEGRVALYANDEALLCNEVGNPGVNCDAPGGLPFGLNARWRSPLTGFVNMHHRWYSPRMGEFLSHDPLAYIDTYNLFGFATFDPVNGYDPFGLANQDHVGWNRYNPVFRIAVAVYNATEDEVDKDRRRDPKQKEKMGLRGQRNGGFRKDATFSCGLICEFELVFEVADSAADIAGVAGAAKGIARGIAKGAKHIPIPKKGPKPRPCSFAKGTQVQMCDGSEKNIEDVKVGDYVLGKEEITEEIGCGLVSALHRRVSNDIVTLALRSEDGHVSFEKATAEHPFYVIDKGFVDVGDLVIGDVVETLSGQVEVVSLLNSFWKKPVFNLTVEKYETYFIGEGKSWVHNCFSKYTAGGDGILAEIGSDGILDLVIKKGPGTPSGGQMFNEAVKHFGSKVKGIRGTWIGKGDLADNFNSFRNAIANGASQKAAAFQTFTGKMAQKNGFTNAKVVENTGNVVKVVFSK